MKSSVAMSFKRKRVLLVGDAILDMYIYCNAVGQALYADVPEVEEIKTKVSFGGNGLVATNILELGGNLTFVSVVGDDEDARQYDSFVHPRMKKIFFVDPTRKTTVKRRWYVGEKALLQVNTVDNHSLSVLLEKKLIGRIEKEARKADVIVVMDPQHGLLTKSVINRLKKISRELKKPLYVDGQISHRKSNHYLYRGVDCILLNEKEARAVYPAFDIKTPQQTLLTILKKLELKNVVVKLGDKGSIALCNGRYIKTSPYKVKAVDTCGAGDAFLAAFSLGDMNTPEESLAIANMWGALSTKIHGTIPPGRKELVRIIKENTR
ncbi:MAG: PfkB family carbohydrate kinase [Patescibacteria group bacterium]|nr:PfkB family carbohydrate kinase [Patescibacteria group bacterium]